MKHRSFALLVLGVALTVLLSACGTTTGDGGATLTPQITNGNADSDAHPYVGLMVALDGAGNPLWRCSGTLVSPTLFLTAGHCTEAPAVRGTIWFSEDVEAGIPGNGYPYVGDVSGTVHTHPQFDSQAFYLHDLGVVVLDEAVDPSGDGTYGALPSLGVLDGFATARGQQDNTVTAVGYGLQASSVNGKKTTANRVRLKAVLDIVDLKGTAGIPAGTSVMVSGNHHTGGTCFGDSGGPMFLQATNIVVAVTSFGLNQNCGGVGGGYRVDQADDLAFVDSYLSAAP